MPRAICRRLLRHLMRFPFSLAAARAGNSNPARMAMMAMTTSNSIKVKPRRRGVPGGSAVFVPVAFMERVRLCQERVTRFVSATTSKRTAPSGQLSFCRHTCQGAIVQSRNSRRDADHLIESRLAGLRREFGHQRVSISREAHAGNVRPQDIGEAGGLLNAMFLRGVGRLYGQPQVAIGQAFHG